MKAPLGLPPSPIQAPLLDATGNLRQDNPNVASPQGQGDNVFKDRGAIDRADFAGSVAQLINPRDEVFTGSPPLTTTATDRNGAADYRESPEEDTGIKFQIVPQIGVEDGIHAVARARHHTTGARHGARDGARRWHRSSGPRGRPRCRGSTDCRREKDGGP